MAIEDDLHKRRKQKRAQEDEEERQRTEKKQTTDPSSSGRSAAADLDPEGEPIVIEKLDEHFRRAEVMIDQVNGMYLSFIRGVDTQSPLPRRAQLETLMATLSNFPKPTPLYRFKFYNLLSTYTQYRDRWDKLMKDLEDGKIKRPPRMKGPFRRSG